MLHGMGLAAIKERLWKEAHNTQSKVSVVSYPLQK